MLLIVAFAKMHGHTTPNSKLCTVCILFCSRLHIGIPIISHQYDHVMLFVHSGKIHKGILVRLVVLGSTNI